MTASMESEGRTANGPGEVEVEESDSEDSIFFTQKVQKSTPDDASSSRLSRRSIPIDPRFLEPESSSEDEYVPKKGKCLPVYNFPFINQRKVPKRGSISSGTNSAIHHSAVAGFFHCFGAMWPNGQSENSLELLPSIDSDDEEITPITEDEKSDEEDIKIIDKQLFVYSLNPQITKRSQPGLNNKRKEATKPTKRSNTCQYFVGTTMLRSSKNPEVCSNERQTPEDGSDVSLQEGLEPIVSSNFPTEKQSTLQNESVQLSTKVTNYTPLDGQNENQSIFNQESMDPFEDDITTCPLPKRRKDKTPRRTNCNPLNEETLPTSKLTPASCNNEKQVKQSSVEEETELPEDHSDGAIRKRNKKKRKKKKGDVENVEKLASLQTQDDGQFDNIAAVDSCVSLISSDGRKHKRKKQTVRDCEEGGVLKEVTPDDRGMDERRGNADVVNDDYGGTDCIVTQSEKSVRKKKKKKSRVLSAETVENAPLLPSLSVESCQGEGKLRISTNGTESAEISKLLQETELGKKVKKIRKDNGDLCELDQRVKATEMSKKCIQSRPCGLKKKKSSQTIEKIPSDGSKNTATCANVSESSNRKNKSKGHSYDGDAVETLETDLQSDTMRRKKHKYSHSEQIESELSAASSRKKKRRKKILFDNNDTL